MANPKTLTADEQVRLRVLLARLRRSATRPPHAIKWLMREASVPTDIDDAIETIRYALDAKLIKREFSFGMALLHLVQQPNDPIPGSMEVPVAPVEIAIPDDERALEAFQRAIQAKMREASNQPVEGISTSITQSKQAAETAREQLRHRERLRGAAALMGGLASVLHEASPLKCLGRLMAGVAIALHQRLVESTDHRPLELD